jgi:hypothetical protein
MSVTLKNITTNGEAAGIPSGKLNFDGFIELVASLMDSPQDYASPKTIVHPAPWAILNASRRKSPPLWDCRHSCWGLRSGIKKPSTDPGR